MTPRNPGLSRRSLLGLGAAAGVGLAGLGLTACSTGGTGGGGFRAALSQYKSNDTEDATTGRTITGWSTFMAGTKPPSTVSFTDIVADSANATVSKIQTLLLGGQIDILQGATVYPYFDQGLLIDLQKYYDRDKWRDNFVESIFKPPAERVLLPAWSSSPTGVVSSPDSVTTSTVAFDNQLFEDFGVEPLASSPTIEEIVEKAGKLTGKNPRTGEQCYGMYYDPRGAAHLVLVYFAHGLDLGKVDPADPSLITFDTPEVRAGIEAMMAAAKLCPPGFEVGQGAENWNSDQNTVAINMAVTPPGMLKASLSGLANRYVVTEGVKDRRGATPYIGANEWAISSKCSDPDAAWEVIKFITGPEGQRYLYQNYGTLPSWKNADWVDDKESPYAKAFLACAAAASNVFFPNFTFRTFRPWLASVMSQAISGKQVDLAAGLADQQAKAEEWAATQKGKQG